MALSTEEKRELYSAAVERSSYELKGKNNLYTSMNGNMTSFIGKDGIAGLRLSPEQRKQFMKKFKSGQPVQYSTVMKDYVEIPDTVLSDGKLLDEYFAVCFEHAKTLPVKPTKK